MRESQDWNSLTTKFFLRYFTEDSVYYTPSGNMEFTSMRECAQLLLEHKVFASTGEMKKQALKDCGVILPDGIFK